MAFAASIKQPGLYAGSNGRWSVRWRSRGCRLSSRAERRRIVYITVLSFCVAASFSLLIQQAVLSGFINRFKAGIHCEFFIKPANMG